MPVFVKSEVNAHENVKAIMFDKEAIEKMDIELQDVVKNIFAGRHIDTDF